MKLIGTIILFLSFSGIFLFPVSESRGNSAAVGVQLCWFGNFSHCKWLYPLQPETCYDMPYPLKEQLLSGRSIGPMTYGSSCNLFKSTDCRGPGLWLDTVGLRTIQDRVYKSFKCQYNYGGTGYGYNYL